MNAPVERPLRKAAVRSGDDVLPADEIRSRTMRSETNSGCSTMLVAWLITPGTSMRPAGSLASRHTFHSCSWRGLAPSIT